MLTRALAVLFAFSAERKNLSLAELALATGICKPTLLRYLGALRAYHLVERSADTYHLGFGSFELGSNFLANLDVVQVARLELEELAATCQETASLAVADGRTVVYTDIARGQAEIGVQSRVGSRQPLHCSALGKVLLAWRTEADRDTLVYSEPMTRLTANTICDRTGLERELAIVRRQGYAYDREERLEGIRCVAAPIRDHRGDVVAAISVSGAASRMKGAKMDVARDRVTETAASVSRSLGSRAATLAGSPRVRLARDAAALQ
jgi:DNA-binding IclR family transcriptional regulator